MVAVGANGGVPGHIADEIERNLVIRAQSVRARGNVDVDKRETNIPAESPGRARSGDFVCPAWVYRDPHATSARDLYRRGNGQNRRTEDKRQQQGSEQSVDSLTKAGTAGRERLRMLTMVVRKYP